ncbi:exodeoxyribonuclease V subunit alpha [Rubrivivax gelatinosus]|uniref:exodeoxyribonuclease V subunit alpha n=1 Tax=Rubrivivax gelatinosus TaxID=28068 RepID=UPI001908371F|nr:exodeoxyribonuclease V subunit alpha [Rubrivivax gelatinosus]MBK1614753.1 exodeoxyribonuclease V subunit alpha [Rubrivivax gelatinosus]
MSRRRRPDEDTLPLFGEADWPAAEPAPQPPAPADDDSGWSPALPAEALPDLDVFFDEDGTLLDAPPPEDQARPETPAEALAAGLAEHLQRWALRLGATADAAAAAGRAGAALSRAGSAGHVCLLLDELAADGTPAATWRARLEASCVVADAAAPGTLPLVLDADGRLYLQREFDHERRLAARLKEAARPAGGLDAAMTARLAELFAANVSADGAPDWQRAAAALALRQRLAVVSGGPGTGKTTTVVALLACLLAADPGCRIALAAPTGKAAARLTDAIRQRAASLPADIQARLPQEASTVHRLLRAGPEGFFHDATRPLALDALIVDEASMLDLALARRLLDAVPPGARIVLLGDKDQLAAVESGAVFAELSADPSLTPDCRAELAAACGVAPEALQPPPSRAAVLPDTVIWFTRNFRFAADSGIGRLATLVNGGRGDEALAWLRAGGDASVRWHDESGREPGEAVRAAIAAGVAPYVQALRSDPQDAAAVTRAFERFRVLCATRDGGRGVAAVNQQLGTLLRQALGQPAGPWFVGRPVMVRRNDYVLKLFNGDIGITLPDAAGELAVVFPAPGGGWRRIAPARLPPHDTAFGMTVHQSQGSEFEQVLLLLPERPSRVLTRELLYTGLTRARAAVAVAGPAEVLAAAIRSPTRRRSGLAARLHETPTT